MNLQELVRKYIRETITEFINTDDGFNEWIYNNMLNDEQFPYEAINTLHSEKLWKEIEKQSQELIAKL